ncbi:nuclear transport factor 2 family protein [Sphingobacterium spiritivorum]|uniref:nuclear transport factor 2 family protein n=1 Tax=Sphingobacterium spiritivorum TaxID=258 RepID=UPI003DA264DD
MKTIIKTIATALLLITSFSSFANENPDPLKNMNSMAIVRTFLEASALGQATLNEELLAKDFQYYNASSPDLTYNKKQYSEFLKSTKGLKYNCKTSYQILDESGSHCVAKVTMKFENFTRVDYITLNRSTESWKVSKVVSTFP